MSNLGWSSDNVWTFSLPIANPIYCVVINTEIIDVTEDGDPSTAVYFHGNEACNQPCNSISVDVAKVEYDLKFKIKSTFSYSND